MALHHPSPTRARAALVVLGGVTSLAAAWGGCSSEASDIFGESAAAGPTSGPGGDGGQGDGAAGPTVAATGTTTGSSPTSSVSSTGEGPGVTTVTTGDGGAPGDGGAGPTTTGDGGGGGGTTTESGPTSTVAGAMCSDGEVNGDEQCDGADLAGASCASLGYPGNGSLGCTDACTYDVTDCSKCGNGQLDAGEDCDDGGVTANDGCDTNCHFEGTACNDPIDIELGLGESATIETTNAEGPAANGSCFNAGGAGRIVRVDPTDDGYVTAWVRRDGTTFDSSLRMAFTCPPGDATELCADSFDPNQQVDHPSGGEVGSLRVEQGIPVYVFINAYEAAAVGDFTIEITLSRGRCDDPVVVPVEAGSDEGIVLRGHNLGEGNDERGECGFENGAGNGEDVSYQLVAVDGASPVDVRIEPAEGSFFNPVLHARIGACDDPEDEVDCGVSGGSGQAEQIFDLDVDPGAFVHADATQGSVGRYTMTVTPPVP